jgi:arsenate reductase (glutaredoxin)
MKITILHYPVCNTCKKAIQWLKDNNIEFVERNISTDRPTKEELNGWYQKSELPLNKFFNTSGKLYKELNLKEKVKTSSEDELVFLLSTHGMLVKRPLVINDDFILVGFKEEEWEKALLS